MTETIVINPPRKRTKYIMVDLSNPEEYFIEITRETVKEISDSEVIFDRSDLKVIREKITFDANGNPQGDSNILPIIPMIKSVIDALDP